ncbi:factor VII-activating protease-like isoform X3 [Rhinoraja longicauda]
MCLLMPPHQKQASSNSSFGIDDCCKEDNESTYQGHASHARHGKRCLYWNSHIILSPQMILQMQNNGSEFEEHNYCRF